jgi:hypothetical protein
MNGINNDLCITLLILLSQLLCSDGNVLGCWVIITCSYMYVYRLPQHQPNPSLLALIYYLSPRNNMQILNMGICSYCK